MPKEKVIDDVIKTVNSTNSTNSTNNIILQYAPLIIGLISLVLCYLLFKKIQTLNSQGDSISKMEKQFTNYVKEQSEINTINSKKFNTIISQMNQLSYIIHNSNNRESNTFTTQMSPERNNNNKENINETIPDKVLEQPVQRELMPTSVIQTNFPIKSESNDLPTPVSTTNKKETENLSTKQKSSIKNDGNKKVIDLHTLKEEVLIEEASSDED
jgi:hypothetical protein